MKSFSEKLAIILLCHGRKAVKSLREQHVIDPYGADKLADAALDSEFVAEKLRVLRDERKVRATA